MPMPFKICFILKIKTSWNGCFSLFMCSLGVKKWESCLNMQEIILKVSKSEAFFGWENFLDGPRGRPCLGPVWAPVTGFHTSLEFFQNRICPRQFLTPGDRSGFAKPTRRRQKLTHQAMKRNSNSKAYQLPKTKLLTDFRWWVFKNKRNTNMSGK